MDTAWVYEKLNDRFVFYLLMSIFEGKTNVGQGQFVHVY